jgi:hypothetical protein
MKKKRFDPKAFPVSPLGWAYVKLPGLDGMALPLTMIFSDVVLGRIAFTQIAVQDGEMIVYFHGEYEGAICFKP